MKKSKTIWRVTSFDLVIDYTKLFFVKRCDSSHLKLNFLLNLDVFLIQSWTHSLILKIIIFVIMKCSWHLIFLSSSLLSSKLFESILIHYEACFYIYNCRGASLGYYNPPSLMQSYSARALDRRLQVDWARDPREGPRVLISLRVDFEPMG